MKVGIEKKKLSDRPESASGCIVCRSKLIRFDEPVLRRCYLCGTTIPAAEECSNGHFVCDACLAMGAFNLLSYLETSKEKDPAVLLQQIMNHPAVHLHGPEHHSIVPFVLLTAYANCGGDLCLTDSLKDAIARGKQIPEGACADWGACGAAIGAGIFASVVLESSPLKLDKWAVPNDLTARCLTRIAEVGGPRCCKRASYLTVETTAAYCSEVFRVPMQTAEITCRHTRYNRACLQSSCPFFKVAEANRAV